MLNPRSPNLDLISLVSAHPRNGIYNLSIRNDRVISEVASMTDPTFP